MYYFLSNKYYKKLVSGSYNMKNQKIDYFFKSSAILFAQMFLDMFDIDYHITGLYRNELSPLKGNTLFADLVFETQEKVLLNIEFQDVKITEKHLERYVKYKVALTMPIRNPCCNRDNLYLSCKIRNKNIRRNRNFSFMSNSQVSDRLLRP